MGQPGSRPPLPGPRAIDQAWGHTNKTQSLLSKDLEATWGDKPHTHKQLNSDRQ